MTYSIVVVDDDPIIRMDIREMLEDAGYRVTGEASNGKDAIELVSKLRPDLVIMDVKMPQMNGIKSSRIIRKMFPYQTAVLLLTAYSERELVRDARDAGVTAYLVKPVSEADLIPAVEIALSQQERLASMQHNMDALRQKMEDRKVIEKAKGLLMQALTLDEEQAYNRMRVVSMTERMSLAKLAEQIISDGVQQWSEKLMRV